VKTIHQQDKLNGLEETKDVWL